MIIYAILCCIIGKYSYLWQISVDGWWVLHICDWKGKNIKYPNHISVQSLTFLD
jgi:hypothetical protein